YSYHFLLFLFIAPTTPELYPLSLHDALPICANDYLIRPVDRNELLARTGTQVRRKRLQDRLQQNYQRSLSLALTDELTGLYNRRSEEHTSELQSLAYLVCRLLLEKKKKKKTQ